LTPERIARSRHSANRLAFNPRWLLCRLFLRPKDYGPQLARRALVRLLGRFSVGAKISARLKPYYRHY
jgi:hypothetical protein